MNLHDRLLIRSVGSVLTLVILSMLFGWLGDFRADQSWLSLPFAVAMLGTIAATRLGFGRISAWFLTMSCTTLLLGYLAVSGGIHSHYAPYVATSVFAAWIWAGPRGGIAVTVLISACLLGLGVVDPEPQFGSPTQSLDIALACIIAGIWVALVVHDLQTLLQQRLQAVEGLEQSAREAQWDAQARDRFLTMVSHEFRTPLNVVLGYEEMLREEEDNPERIRDLERIHAAGQHLLALIDDLIDLSNTEDADLPLAVEPVALKPIIHEVSLITQPLVQLRGNTWKLDAEKDLPTVAADPRRTFQILLNLVSNAAKYTSGGVITLRTSVEGDQVTVSIEDTGVGIPPDKLQELFEPFSQVQETGSQQAGLGLGLALSQRWAQTMGGRIEVDSKVGRGSQFRLHLPIAA